MLTPRVNKCSGLYVLLPSYKAGRPFPKWLVLAKVIPSPSQTAISPKLRAFFRFVLFMDALALGVFFLWTFSFMESGKMNAVKNSKGIAWAFCKKVVAVTEIQMSMPAARNGAEYSQAKRKKKEDNKKCPGI